MSDSPSPLNEHARRAKAAFCAAFPQYSGQEYPYGRWAGPGDPLDEIMFDVEHPEGKLRLFFGTWRGSVRVDFGPARKEWKPARGHAPGTDAIDAAIDLVRDILAERVVVVFRRSRGLLRWVAPRRFEAIIAPAAGGRFAEEKGFLASRSWSGTFDRGTVPSS